MLKRITLMVVAALLSCGIMEAQICGINGNVKGFIDYLYLKPSIDDTYFVIDSPFNDVTFPDGKRRNNDFCFDSGFRIGLGYVFCDCDRELTISYTRLNTETTKTVSGNFLSASIGQADFAGEFERYTGTARSKLDFCFQKGELLFAQCLYQDCGLSFGLRCGLEAADIELKEDYKYETDQNFTGLIKQTSEIDGIGPQFGFHAEYSLCDISCLCPGHLSIHADSFGSLLASCSKSKALNRIASEEDPFLDVSDSDAIRVIPALHARAGLKYAFCVKCVDASVEVGYEFSSYFRALARTGYPDDLGKGLSYTYYNNIDLQGLYVSASVQF